ncbi:MAG: type II secretion system protein J [Phycisphaerales bacterium]
MSPGRSRRGFSMVEMLIALTVSSLLMTACLVALDRSFKVYEATTESASTHVVSRLVMHRVLGMIRQGEEFGPYPVGVLVPTKLDSNYVEFVSLDDAATGQRQVTRLERVPTAVGATTYQLQFTRTDFVNGTQTAQFSYPLIRNLRDAKFTLEYDIGPVLRRATVDLTIQPDDASTNVTAISTSLPGQVLRLIASTTPRRLD